MACVEVDQVIFLAAVCIMTVIAGILVMFIVSCKPGVIRAVHIGLIRMALEAQFTS